MSSQKGNITRTRTQKHQNRTAFKNNLHDTSKRQEKINSLEVCYVCEQCKNVIEWKIKYKKYKPLSQPKTCLTCQQKSIKFAYHTVCGPCAEKQKICCKCQQGKEIVQPFIKKTKDEILVEMDSELKGLSERKRRAFVRYLEKTYGKKKKKKNLDENGDVIEEVENETELVDEEDPKAIKDHSDYLEKARQKLEELGKGLLKGFDDEDDDCYSDIDDDEDF